MSTADKLNKLVALKANVKTALENKIGETLSQDISSWIPKIESIESAGEYIIDGVKALNLPEGVTLYEYIESSGTQWIDTEVNVTPSSDIEQFFEIDIDGYNNNTWMGLNNILQLNVKSNHLGDGEKDFLVSGKTKVWYNIKNGLSSLIVELVANTNNRTGNYNGSIYIFKMSGYDSIPVKAKLYKYQIKENGILIRNLIPCTYNEQVGMWDTINSKFYANKGTGEFTVHTLLEYVQGQRSSFIFKDGILDLGNDTDLTYGQNTLLALRWKGEILWKNQMHPKELLYIIYPALLNLIREYPTLETNINADINLGYILGQYPILAPLLINNNFLNTVPPIIASTATTLEKTWLIRSAYNYTNWNTLEDIVSHDDWEVCEGGFTPTNNYVSQVGTTKYSTGTLFKVFVPTKMPIGFSIAFADNLIIYINGIQVFNSSSYHSDVRSYSKNFSNIISLNKGNYIVMTWWGGGNHGLDVGFIY